MNYLHQPSVLVHFWAGVHTEFEAIIGDFVRRDGWLFQDLCEVAKRADIAALHRCVPTTVHRRDYGKGDRLDHFTRVNATVLDVAKVHWLLPWRKYVVDPSGGVIPPFLKRQLGGFFLLYMLYSRQPVPIRRNRLKMQKIDMDRRDLLAMHVFIATMQKLPKGNPQWKELARQIVVIFNDLVVTEAFQFCVTGDTFTTMNQGVRKQIANKLCQLTELRFSLKDVRDQLQFIACHESVPVFRALVCYGNFLPKEPPVVKIKTEIDPNETSQFSRQGSTNIGEFPEAKSWPVEEILALREKNNIGVIANSIPSILKSLDFGPVIQTRKLTGITEHVLQNELSKCAQAYYKSEAHKTELYCMKQQQRLAPQSRISSLKNNVWRRYLNGDYEWVGEAMSCSWNSSPEQTQETVNEQTHIKNLSYIKQEMDDEVMDVDDGDHDWETDSSPDDEDYDYFDSIMIHGVDPNSDDKRVSIKQESDPETDTDMNMKPRKAPYLSMPAFD